VSPAPPVDRRRVAPPPDTEDELLATPVHRIVMAWPETLEVLRLRGVLPGPAGGRPLGDLADAPALASAVLEATRWRLP
jgi:hypothetical protein